MATFLHNDSDQTDVYHDLSSHLHRVLEAVGVSEEVRRGHREWATVSEILFTVQDKVKEDGLKSWYIFGSQYEGTTTFGQGADTDMLYCDERVPVVENIDDAPVNGKALLMLSDDTKPGYVKLQSVINRTKQTIKDREVTDEEDTDHQGRILAKHLHSTKPNLERHGPAVTIPAEEGVGARDFVHAYRCRTIPSFADEWLHRHRPYQWPSQERLQRMSSYGCFFVGVSHPNSEDEKTEWRISFSLQERDLMTSLNPTQHKCLVLLKMIKKDIIQPRVDKSLSSYHFKTCIFHLAESRGVEQWTPNDLVPRILECIRLLLEWVRQDNCPNYFIMDENMFDKLDKSTLTKLSDVLQELLSKKEQCVCEIRCDNLGKLLKLSYKSDRRLQKKKLKVKQDLWISLNADMTRNVLDIRTHLYRFIDDYASTHQERVSLANHILQYLKHNEVITEHEARDVQMALDRVIPFIRFLIIRMKCSNKLEQMADEKDDEAIQAFARKIQLCRRYDLISSGLMAASLYLQYDKFYNCKEILQNCKTSLKRYVLSTCGCGYYVPYIDEALKEKKVHKNIWFEQFCIECTAACIIFLPFETNIVPAALRYEMYRSVYTPPGSRNDFTEYWFDLIAVDSKVYMYYLQYILNNKTNTPASKHDAVVNLQHLIDDEYEYLGHRETALNLLGWIFTQENRVQDAFDFFRRSLDIRPLHNAAKWHMAILLHSLITPQAVHKRKLSSSCDDDTDLTVDKRTKLK